MSSNAHTRFPRPNPAFLGSLLLLFVAILQGCGSVASTNSNPSNPSTPGKLTISTSMLPSGQVGTAYNTMLSATGGTPPYAWTLVSGTLPAGIALNMTTGALTGTPTQAVSATPLTFQVADASSPASTQTISLTLTIAASSNPVTISVAPVSITLQTQATQQFTANVQNTTNTAVTWQVNSITGGNSSVGTISASGLYTAPNSVPSGGSVTVTAISQADTTKSASAQVTITAAVVPVAITTTSLPGATSNAPYSHPLQATGGSGSYTWTLTSAVTGFSLSSSGLLSGTPTSTATLSFAVKVADSGNPSNSATAMLSLSVQAPPAITISIAPQSVSVHTGATQQFTANVTNTSNTAVTWQVNSVTGGNSTVGTISTSGLYTAPNNVPAGGTVTITAISQADTTKTTSTQVTITTAVVPVAITTASLPQATVNAAYSQQLAATGGSGSFTWTLTTPVSGFALSSSGLLTGTPTSTTTLSFAVKAADSANTSNSATTTLSLTVKAAPVVTITISPTSATVDTGDTQQFGTTVKNSSNTAVTWQVNSITGGNSTLGTISGSGLYTAPGSVPTGGTVTVTAVSQADATKSASAQVTISAASSAVLITTSSLPSASVNVAYSQQLSASGGSGTYTWSLTSPVTGFSLSSSGLLSGTPTSTTSLSFSIKVADASNASNSATSTLSLTVNAASAGNAFYVATTGNDSNAGTLASPWKTIQHAASTVKAGSTVYVRAGVYNESVNIPSSGSSSAGPITFQNYNGEAAIVDGTGLTPPNNVNGLFNIDGQSYVTIQGFEIRNYQTSSANATPAGIWITGSGSNIQILNNAVHNIVTTSEANGNAFGIAVYGTEAPASLDSVTISGNQVYSLKTGESESLNVDGNVTNFVISNNIIHDNDNIGIDVIGFEGVSSDSNYDYARNGSVTGNTVYNISAKNNPGEGSDYDADGIYVDGGANVIIERNLVHNVDIGIEMASEHSGHVASNVIARNNIVYASNVVGITIGGYANNVGGTDSCTIVNNTLYGNDTTNSGSGEFQIQYHATNNVFKNNIVYATSQGLFVNNFTNSTPNPATLDYNLYYSSLGSSGGDFLWLNKDYSGFAAFQSGTGNDSHSIFGNPLFVSTSTPDFHVQASSPAVNAGTNLGSSIVGTVDFGGSARVQGTNIDIGAYEQ